MSSASLAKVLRSTTFRRTLLAFLILTAVVCGGLAWVVERSARSAILAAYEEVGEIVDDVYEHTLEEEDVFEFEDAGGWEEPLDLDLDEDLATRGFWNQYIEEISEILGEEELEPSERRPLEARLALLGEPGFDSIGRRLQAAIAEVMFEEVPEEHHPFLDGVLRTLGEQDEDARASTLRSQDVLELTNRREWLVDDWVCFRLTTSRFQVLATNFEPRSRPAYFEEARHFWTEVPAALLEELEPDEEFPEELDFFRRRCLVQEIELINGTLEIGVNITEAYRSRVFLRSFLAGCIVVALILSALFSFLLAQPPVRFLTDLRRASTNLREGDYTPRLRRNLDGEFGQAIDETNAMLDQLERSIGSLSHVTDNIAHDLRTPLTRLQGQLDLLKRHPQPDGGMIEAVQDEADQLLATFNALLRIAQVESGRRRRGFRQLDLAQVVEDVGELYGPVFSDRETLFHCSTVAAVIEGDSDLWMQALSNLLDNALKYTSDGGEVSMILAQKPGGVVLELRDDGPGIPESELEHVFERFYRLPQHRRSRGSGLGLSLVRAICDLHRAKIELENDGGLVVRISFAM